MLSVLFLRQRSERKKQSVIKAGVIFVGASAVVSDDICILRQRYLVLGMVQIRYWASAAAAAGGLSYGAGGR